MWLRVEAMRRFIRLWTSQEGEGRYRVTAFNSHCSTECSHHHLIHNSRTGFQIHIQQQLWKIWYVLFLVKLSHKHTHDACVTTSCLQLRAIRSNNLMRTMMIHTASGWEMNYTTPQWTHGIPRSRSSSTDENQVKGAEYRKGLLLQWSAHWWATELILSLAKDLTVYAVQQW